VGVDAEAIEIEAKLNEYRPTKVKVRVRKFFMAGESRENENFAESYPHAYVGGCPSR
jgi:hypothetical protein